MIFYGRLTDSRTGNELSVMPGAHSAIQSVFMRNLE
jgi:hypothetical protein